MKKYIKKISMQFISTVLTVIITFNNVLADPPKINIHDLEEYFQTSSSSKLYPNHSGEYRLIRYNQKGGTYSDEIRDVYIWNLPGIASQRTGGICGYILSHMRNVDQRLDTKNIESMIEWGKTVSKTSSKAAFASIAYIFLDNARKYTGLSSQDIINKITSSMEFFGVKDSKAFTSILNKGIKVFDDSAKSAPYVALLAIVFTIAGMCIGLAGVAELNEQARNVADTETIICTFFTLIRDQAYLGSNLVVMAKDNTPIRFYNPFRQSEEPYIGFYKHDGLIKFNAPIFEKNWVSYQLNDLPECPEWARAFLTGVDASADRLLSPEGDVRKLITSINDKIDAIYDRSTNKLKGQPSRPAIEDKKTTLK